MKNERCEYCGAGDDSHHSYTCPTGKHPNREFEPEYFSGLNWRDAEKLVKEVVEFSCNGNGWNKGRLSHIDKKDFAEHRYQKYRDPAAAIRGGYTYIRTCQETYVHPTLNIGGVKLPRPETKPPEEGAEYCLFDPTDINAIGCYDWSGDKSDLEWLKSGCIHLTEARAQAWADWWENTVIKAMKGE
jgi:hypothetical protein